MVSSRRNKMSDKDSLRKDSFGLPVSQGSSSEFTGAIARGRRSRHVGSQEAENTAALFKVSLPTSIHIIWKNLSQTLPVVCLLGDSRPCQIDSINHHDINHLSQ